MKFWERNSSAKYRAEGLNLSQVDRLKSGEKGSNNSVLIAALAFVAVGSLAYIGLQTISGPRETVRVFSAAPPEGTAFQMMMALKVPHDIEKENARLALLNDETGPMEIRSLETVEQLIHPEDTPEQVKSATAAAITQEEAPLSVVSQALPVPDLPDVTPQAEAEPEIVEVAAVATPEPASATCFDALQDFAAEATIYFDIGSTQITTDNIVAMRKLGLMVMDCPFAKVHVTGHSDTTGNDLANLNLSWQRADNVVTALTQIGIDTSKFEPVGFGARAPLSQGDASDEDLNRRVEFVILRDSD